MCGIAGIRDTSGRPLKADVERMTRALAHRGPDGEGIYTDSEAGIALGHRRLAVIDLTDAAAQPMRSSDGHRVITFNGEIYNYLELRDVLEREGSTFRTRSDTEVILEAFKVWGPQEAVSRLRGMFAFAIWDASTRSLFLVRDRLGVKPLYYHHQGSQILFASELKALLSIGTIPRDVDRGALTAYLHLGYVPAPRSILSGVSKVMPGTIVEIGGDGSLRQTAYWGLDDHVTDARVAKSDQEVEEELADLLSDAVKSRLVSDVPLGVFLSGGVDSSLVSAIISRAHARPVRSFTIRFEEADKDESPWARRVAEELGCEHEEFLCTTKDALGLLDDIPMVYDEPFSDSSTIPTLLLCRRVSERLKVALSGDGGDEFFCGYDTYGKFALLWERLSKIPPPARRVAARALRALPPSATSRALAGLAHRMPSLDIRHPEDKVEKLASVMESRTFADAYWCIVSIWSRREITALVESRPDFSYDGAFREHHDPLTTMMQADARTLLPDGLLVKVDRASMSVGLEVREPLLDHALVEYAVRLPSRFKRRAGRGKHALKQVLARYLPQELVERPKQGFSIPLEEWMRGPLRPIVERTLDPERVRIFGLLDPSEVSRVLEEFFAGRSVDPRKIWNLLILQKWCEKWLVPSS